MTSSAASASPVKPRARSSVASSALASRRAAAKRVAEGAGATWVPFQSMFDEAVKDAKPEYWAGDGVHPSMAGHALMASTWLRHVL